VQCFSRHPSREIIGTPDDALAFAITLNAIIFYVLVFIAALLILHACYANAHDDLPRLLAMLLSRLISSLLPSIGHVDAAN